MTESITKAAAKTASTTAKKPAAKKPASTAKKKTGTAAKAKTASSAASSAVKLSTAERTLIRNYRKCSAAEKKIVDAVAEKLSGDIDVGGILSILKEYAMR